MAGILLGAKTFAACVSSGPGGQAEVRQPESQRCLFRGQVLLKR
jgi:hypothetical protein